MTLPAVLASDEPSQADAAIVRLRALINAGIELSAERDSERLLQRVCTAARDLFGATYVTLGLFGSDDLTVTSLQTCASNANNWIRVGDAISGILRAVVGAQQTIRGQNPGGNPVTLHLPASHPEVRAFMAVPISSASQAFGWIFLVFNDGRQFTEDDEQLVQALATQVANICALQREVDERKRAEEAMRAEHARAQRYLDTAEVILLALDIQGRVTDVNRYACGVFGWTIDELIGKDFIETLIPAHLRDDVRRTLGDVLAGPVSSIVDNMIVTRNGEERLIEWRNTLLRDTEGQVVGTLSSGTDLTERNKALVAVGTAEERMRFALEAAGVGIWDQDYVTGVLQWSEILESHHGFARGTFDGTFESFVSRIHPDDRADALEVIGKAIKSGTDFTVTYRAVWPDETVRWLNGAGRIHLDEHGEPVRGVGITMDVTDGHTLEMQYQQAQKMEAIGRLAGGVAHDFNNLLTGILGYCELVLEDLKPDDPHSADIEEIRKAGITAAELTQQLLTFSRKQIIEPKLLDVNAVVGGILPMLTRLIGEDVNIVLRLRPDVATIRADPGQIDQILLNLSVNARDAMPSGGTLTIETANVELDENYINSHFAAKPGHYTVLTVTDTGTGMTSQVQAHLFEPFFTTKEVGKGTGLGLATVHGIVMRNGGSINVYTELGRGTSFKVYFPQAVADGVKVQAPSAVQSYHGHETILIVEDAEGLRELTRRLLERLGYTVVVASSAAEAVRLFNEHPLIDVLLTDVVMPGVSGPEVVRTLRLQRPDLKVIYMSGYTEDAIVHYGVIDPDIAFLHKPFTSQMLGRKLREVLDA